MLAGGQLLSEGGQPPVSLLDKVTTKMRSNTGLSFFSEIAAALALVALLMPVVASFAYGNLFHAFGNNPILSFAVLGAFIIHFSGRPSYSECAITIILAAVLHTGYQQVAGASAHYFGYWLINWGTFLGISSLIVLAVRAMRTQGALRMSALSDLMAGGAFFYYWVVLGVFLLLTIHWIPRRYDQLLYAFDTSLGFQPSFQLGQLIHGRPVLTGLVCSLYYAVALPVGLLYASQRRAGYNLGYKIFPLLIAASAGGYVLYYVLPGAGPIYEFTTNFPFRIPPIAVRVGEFLPISERAVCNAMPSLHVGTALMVCWNCNLWSKPSRVCAWLFLIVTAFATMALGEHYLVDLVVACPLMLAFHALAMTSLRIADRERWLPITAGFGATFAWLAFLRNAVAVCIGRPVLSWILVLCTVAGSCWLASRLSNKASSRLLHTPSQAVEPVMATL